MSRRFTVVTLALTAVVAFLVGAIVAGGVSRSSMVAGTAKAAATRAVARPLAGGFGSIGSNFADVVQRINPAVVNIDATSRGHDRRRRNRNADPPDLYDGPDYGGPRSDRDGPRRGAGTGFIIDAEGSILTNNHVIDHADRITVKLSDGRSLRARVVGADPDSDVALIKIDGQAGLPVAPLGDSATLRTGEWVCAIGNPLGYEHSVTVGVVSYIGRKLFDESLDDYIQTDAAINFGNSGGPLINARGEVIGINAAISSRASSIGFAVPINLATAILPQLRTRGHVSRGYIGVALKDVDPDLRESLKLAPAHGALVQDITEGSPAERAGLKPYDVIVALDDHDVRTDDDLIREISARAPGSAARLRLVRDGREQTIVVKLAERPERDATDGRGRPASPAPAERKADPESLLGLTVRDIDRALASRMELPDGMHGVLITKVEAVGPSFEADVDRGMVLLEINRQPVTSLAEFRRIVKATRAGEVLTLFLYSPDLDQRELKTVRVDDR